MNAREHARLAKLLIRECGGLEEASAALKSFGWDKGSSVPSLSNFQNPHVDAFMPANFIQALEEYCGRKLYSRALFEAGSEAVNVANLRDAASEAVEAAADAHKTIRLATADGHLTPRETDEIALKIERATRPFRDIATIISRDEPAA